MLSVKKKIEEAVASGKLAHLVKDIHQNNQRNGNPGRNDVKFINMVRQEGNRKRSFEERRSDVMNELTFPAIPRSQLTDKPIILEGIIRKILVDGGSSSTKIMYEHCFRNLGVNIRSRLRRCRIMMIVERLYKNENTWKGYKEYGRRYIGVNVTPRQGGNA
ncbi:hypothetical protein Tco_1011695, partial [Tanacetum coccineum]